MIGRVGALALVLGVGMAGCVGGPAEPAAPAAVETDLGGSRQPFESLPALTVGSRFTLNTTFRYWGDFEGNGSQESNWSLEEVTVSYPDLPAAEHLARLVPLNASPFARATLIDVRSGRAVATESTCIAAYDGDCVPVTRVSRMETGPWAMGGGVFQGWSPASEQSFNVSFFRFPEPVWMLVTTAPAVWDGSAWCWNASMSDETRQTAPTMYLWTVCDDVPLAVHEKISGTAEAFDYTMHYESTSRLVSFTPGDGRPIEGSIRLPPARLPPVLDAFPFVGVDVPGLDTPAGEERSYSEALDAIASQSAEGARWMAENTTRLAHANTFGSGGGSWITVGATGTRVLRSWGQDMNLGLVNRDGRTLEFDVRHSCQWVTDFLPPNCSYNVEGERAGEVKTRAALQTHSVSVGDTWGRVNTTLGVQDDMWSISFRSTEAAEAYIFSFHEFVAVCEGCGFAVAAPTVVDSRTGRFLQQAHIGENAHEFSIGGGRAATVPVILGGVGAVVLIPIDLAASGLGTQHSK